MHKLHEFFGRNKVVLPVIHVETEEQAIRNVEVAKRAEADGVFLINHNMEATKLLDIYEIVRSRLPDWWIGVNCLDRSPIDVFSRVVYEHPDISGIWTDNATISETDPYQTEARRVLEIISEIGWNGLYFGGVAFKYQPPVDDLRFVTKEASRFVDVVTTSGEGTGIAADINKIRTMWCALDENFTLAVASGTTPENIYEYLPFVDIFLTATGISDSHTELNENRTRVMAKKVHEYSS